MTNETSKNSPLLESCTGCGESLDVTDFAPFEGAVCPCCGTETRVKCLFGSYRLEKEHAKGGMSVIFAGWDTLLDRQVAIKVLNEDFCHDEKRIQDFEKEARLTAQINHPNIIQIYSAGRAHGRFYLVMELLEGQSLEEIIAQRSPLSEEEVLTIALQVTEGLKAAKKAGVIHRDVKPGNILFDLDGNAKLIDFGIALVPDTETTRSKDLWATPYYVSPESLNQDEEDFKSDIYALGASLYHALSGKPPFESTSQATKVLYRVKQTIPRVKTIAPWIGELTAETIDRMMAFQPEHRWESYNAIIAALNHAKAKPGKGRPRFSEKKSRFKIRQLKRTRAWIGFALLLITSLIIHHFKPWVTPKHPTTQLPLQNQPLRTLPEEPVELFSPSGEDLGDLDPFSDDWQKIRQSVANQEDLAAEQDLLTLAKNPLLEPTSRAWAYLEACVTAYFDGRPGEARAHALSASLILKDHLKDHPENKQLQVLTHQLSNPLLSDQPEFPETITTINEALGTLALSLKLWEQNDWQTALEGFQKVLSLQLPETYEWFYNYQKRSQSYLADGELFAELLGLPTPTSKAMTEDQIDHLERSLKVLQTRGRLKYNIRSRQTYLSRLQKGFHQRPQGSFILSWEKMREQLVRSGKSRRFDEIFAMLDNAPDEAPREALWAWKYLHDQTKVFLSNLMNQKGWTTKTSEGAIIVPAEITNEGIKTSNGKNFAWSQLDAASLISAHEAFQNRDQREEVISSICFAYTTGLIKTAEEKAEALARVDHEFQEQWKRVLIGTSL